MASTRVLIAAAGPQTKWGNHLGRPSHLVPLPDGRPLLARTIAQARRFTDDIALTAPPGDWRYRMAGVTVHERGPDFPSEYASTRGLWNPDGRSVLLLGDVYWSDAAIATVMGCPDRDYRVFGRFGPSAITGATAGEIFAAHWFPEHHFRLDELLKLVHDTRATGAVTRPPGWMLLRAWQGTPLNRHRVRRPWFVELPPDETDDLDTPANLARHPVFRHLARLWNEARR